MKKLLLILFSIFGLLHITIAQCSLKTGVTTSGAKWFKASSEKIHSNVDLENGLETAYAYLTVVQSPIDPDLLQFYLDIRTAATGSKRRVTPRNIKIIFKTGGSLDIRAEEIDYENLKGIGTENGFFRLKEDYFLQLKNNEIKSITIYDHRNSNRLICYPYRGLLQEQALCISNRIYP